MAIRTAEIPKKEASSIESVDEGQFSEVKSTDITPRDLSKTISAFANSDGGDLFIGIEDRPRRWNGFISPEMFNGHLQLFEELFPLGTDFGYTFFKSEGMPGIVLFVHVNRTKDIVKASNGIAYIRRGAQNLPQTTLEAIKRLEYSKGIASFENSVLRANKEVVTRSKTAKRFIETVVPSSTPDTWMKKQALIHDEKPTVAGVVLFADEPQAVIPKHSGIKIYRYKTTESEGFREALDFTPETIEGSLYDQIKQAVSRTVEITESSRILVDEEFRKFNYPPDALHELITNALIHRDYSIADDVHVRIFDNRIEIQSPGKFPANITPSNILEERFARNGAIVRILNKFPDPPNKDIGEGLRTAIRSLNKIGLKRPTISERGNSVLVVIKHETLASPEEAIMDFLTEHKDINNREARRLTHITEDYRVKRIFARMLKANQIEQVPGTRAASTRYRKKIA